MGSSIAIQKIAEDSFEVTVSEGGGESTTVHTVRIDDRYMKELGWEMQDVTTLIRESFEFLLEREPKEAILKEFDLSDIAKYFSDYESAISKH